MKKARIIAVLITAAVLVSGFLFTASAFSGSAKRSASSPVKGTAGFNLRFAKFVKNGTVTEDQAKAVKAAMLKAAADQSVQNFKDTLTSLVSANKLTADQQKAVSDSLTAAVTESKLKGIMPAFKKLIDAGTISKAQAADIRKTFIKLEKQNLPAAVKSAINSLVTNGTITQAQADAITGAAGKGKAPCSRRASRAGRTVNKPAEGTAKA